MTEILKVGLKNHVDLIVDAEDPGVLYELREAFSFLAPKHKYSPKYKSGQWDGYIRLFKVRERTLPAGLWPQLKDFAERRQYTLDVLENGWYGVPGARDLIDPRTLWDFIQARELAAEGQPIEIYDYQFAALHEALSARRKILKSPTGTGKSLMMYLLVRWWLEHLAEEGQRFVIIVPTTVLVDQLMGDFADYASREGWPVEEFCHKIYSGQDKTTGHKVLISTWQSLANFPKGFFKNVGAIIGDEAHQYTADVVQGLMRACADAAYRWGTTGTLDRNKKIHDLVLTGAFGDIMEVTRTRTEIDKGRLAKTKINLIKLRYLPEERKGFKLKYPEELKFIETHQGRMDFLIGLMAQLEGNSMILFKHRDHGREIFSRLESAPSAPWTDLFYVDGTTDTSDRDSYRRTMNQTERGILVGSYETVATGLNIRKLHHLVLAAPHKGEIKVLQAIGRTIRPSPDGRMANIWDLIDDISSGKRQNHALRHGSMRAEYYATEEHDTEVFQVNLEAPHGRL